VASSARQPASHHNPWGPYAEASLDPLALSLGLLIVLAMWLAYQSQADLSGTLG